MHGPALPPGAAGGLRLRGRGVSGDTSPAQRVPCPRTDAPGPAWTVNSHHDGLSPHTLRAASVSQRAGGSAFHRERPRTRTRTPQTQRKRNLFPLGKQLQSCPGPGGVNMATGTYRSVRPTRELTRSSPSASSPGKRAHSLQNNYCIYSDATCHIARRTDIHTGRSGGAVP